MKESTAFVALFAMLISVGFGGCSRKNNVRNETKGSVEQSSPRLVTAHFDMQFVWIPPSGDHWEGECRERGMPYKPVDGFYLQEREVSLSQYRRMGGDVEGYSTFTDVDWNQSAIVPSWVEAVNWGHFLSSNDPAFDYRLPTIHEWLYAYRYAMLPERSAIDGLEFKEATLGGFEFATDSILRLPLPIGYAASHASETASHSFVMGRPYGFGPDKPSWNVMANRTPPTGDDGIDEQTFVRFVLVPKATPIDATSSQ